MTKKGYDPNKKVTLFDITGAFLDYTTTNELTKSEYLLIKNAYDVIITQLGESEHDV